jgi:uncharacterized protein YndB with AHSA1/START domain
MQTPAKTLEINRLLKAPRSKVWQAWSDPALLAQWWCPRPWTTEVRAFEFHAGGSFHTFMRGPESGESDNPGCFLEVVPFERIVSTSVMTRGFQPAKTWLPMTAILNLSEEGEGTRYIVHVLHLDEEGAEKHVKMGFYQGWGICIDQLDALAQTL